MLIEGIDDIVAVGGSEERDVYAVLYSNGPKWTQKMWNTEANFTDNLWLYIGQRMIYIFFFFNTYFGWMHIRRSFAHFPICCWTVWRWMRMRQQKNISIGWIFEFSSQSSSCVISVWLIWIASTVKRSPCSVLALLILTQHHNEFNSDDDLFAGVEEEWRVLTQC